MKVLSTQRLLRAYDGRRAVPEDQHGGAESRRADSDRFTSARVRERASARRYTICATAAICRSKWNYFNQTAEYFPCLMKNKPSRLNRKLNDLLRRYAFLQVWAALMVKWKQLRNNTKQSSPRLENQFGALM